MKKYQFKSEASLQTFIKDIKPEKYKILEGNVVEIVAFDEDNEDYRIEDMQYQIKYMWSEMEYLYNMIASHQDNGHLPPIKGAGTMETALKALGMDKDYEVLKPALYANSRGEVEVNFSLLPQKEDE